MEAMDRSNNGRILPIASRTIFFNVDPKFHKNKANLKLLDFKAHTINPKKRRKRE